MGIAGYDRCHAHGRKWEESSGKTQRKKSGCYMTNTGRGNLQGDTEGEEDNKKDMKKGEEGKENDKHKKNTTNIRATQWRSV
jgi:hypothetical protein